MRRRKQGVPPATEMWDPIPREEHMSSVVKGEEVLLRNTFINAQMILTSEPSLDILDLDSKSISDTRIRWSISNLVKIQDENAKLIS